MADNIVPMDISTDIDIDLVDRDTFLSFVDHIPGLNSDKVTRHTVGVYFQDIPMDPLLGTSAFDFKESADLGYFKIDFLNNSSYAGITDDAHLDRLINMEPVWELLEYRDIVEQLPHIHSYYARILQSKPTSIEQLAMFLALIRPGKKHLIDEDWDVIEETTWDKPGDDSYYFKRSHSLAYAMSIVIAMNKLVDHES